MAEQSGVLTQIARPYAAALFDLARTEGALDTVEAGLDALAQLSGQSAEFRRFLASPLISSEAKSRAADVILARAGLPVTVSNFVKVLARNGRLFALGAVIAGFKALAASARGEIAADVTSAAPLSPVQLRNLADTLRTRIGKKVALTEHVDPSLIGGLVVKVGSRMIDSSLKTKLSAMKIAMKEVG